FTRDEAIGRTNAELGIWASDSQLRQVTRLILEKKAVRNFETEFKHRNGSVTPYLMSASVVEVDGRTCIISAARDISDLKGIQTQLIAAREALSTRVEALRRNQELLRAEIAERELAQRRLQESEQALRRIFESSPDTITVKRLRDNRYIDVNRGFELAYYSRKEAIGKTPDELGLWVDPAEAVEFN